LNLPGGHFNLKSAIGMNREPREMKRNLCKKQWDRHLACRVAAVFSINWTGWKPVPLRQAAFADGSVRVFRVVRGLF
jgi:hypothetical protein